MLSIVDAVHVHVQNIRDFLHQPYGTNLIVFTLFFSQSTVLTCTCVYTVDNNACTIVH